MAILDEEWEVKPHNCHIDNNTGKPIPFMAECHSLIIPQILSEPLNAELATKIVGDHNIMLDIREIHNTMPKSPFEGYGLKL